MEIYNADKLKEIIKTELNNNISVLHHEYTYIKALHDPLYNNLIHKYKTYYDESRAVNYQVIDHLNQTILYLKENVDENKEKDIKILYKLMNKLL